MQDRLTRVHGSTRRRRSGRVAELGQGTAELAIMLPLFLVLIVGIIEVAAGFNAYTTVVSAARDGARLGSKGAASDAAIQALVVKDLGRLKNTTPTSNVTVTHGTVTDSNGIVTSAITVKACYGHTTFIHVPLIMPNSITMCSQTTMPRLN